MDQHPCLDLRKSKELLPRPNFSRSSATWLNWLVQLKYWKTDAPEMLANLGHDSNFIQHSTVMILATQFGPTCHYVRYMPLNHRLCLQGGVLNSKGSLVKVGGRGNSIAASFILSKRVMEGFRNFSTQQYAACVHRESCNCHVCLPGVRHCPRRIEDERHLLCVSHPCWNHRHRLHCGNQWPFSAGQSHGEATGPCFRMVWTDPNAVDGSWRGRCRLWSQVHKPKDELEPQTENWTDLHCFCCLVWFVWRLGG